MPNALSAQALAAAPLGVVYVEDVLLLTRRQMKGAALVLLALAAAGAVVWLVVKMRKRAETPSQPQPATTAPPAARAVDPAVANILEKAAARPGDDRSADALYAEAVRVVAQTGTVSLPAIQRKLGVDFETANDLVARMEAEALVSGPAAGRQRKVLPAAGAFVERLDANTDR